MDFVILLLSKEVVARTSNLVVAVSVGDLAAVETNRLLCSTFVKEEGDEVEAGTKRLLYFHPTSVAGMQDIQDHQAGTVLCHSVNVNYFVEIPYIEVILE